MQQQLDIIGVPSRTVRSESTCSGLNCEPLSKLEVFGMKGIKRENPGGLIDTFVLQGPVPGL